MNPDSFLLTVAQVGIGLAGFSALISTFRREQTPLTPTEVIGRSMIIEMGLGATLFALLPFPTESLLTMLNTVGVWRVSSIFLLLFLIGWGLYHVSRAVNLVLANQFIELVQGIFNILLIVVNGFLVLNILFFASSAFYMLGLLWMLSVAGIQFMLFVVQYARQNQ